MRQPLLIPIEENYKTVLSFNQNVLLPTEEQAILLTILKGLDINDLEDLQKKLSLKLSILQTSKEEQKVILSKQIDTSDLTGLEKKEAKKDLPNLFTEAEQTFLCRFLPTESIVPYLRFSNNTFYDMFDFERQRAWKFFNDREELHAHGFYMENEIKDKKERELISKNIKRNSEWADKAYPNYNVVIWETMIDLKVLEIYHKLKQSKLRLSRRR